MTETVFITSDKEGQLLSNGTGARQQQIAEALRKGIEGYLSTHWHPRSSARAGLPAARHILLGSG
jgi:hypothetical protein